MKLGRYEVFLSPSQLLNLPTSRRSLSRLPQYELLPRLDEAPDIRLGYRLYVKPHDRLGSRRAHKHPAVIIKHVFGPIGRGLLPFDPHAAELGEGLTKPLVNIRAVRFGQMNIDPVVKDDSDFLIQSFEKILDRLLLPRDHLRREQAGEYAVLLGHVVLDGHARALLAAEDDLALHQKVADIFESDAGLVHLDAVLLGDGIDEMRRGDGTGGAALPAARPAKVVQEKREHLVGVDVRSVRVQYPESVSVAVHGEADVELPLSHRSGEFREVFLGGFGRQSAEHHVPVSMEHRKRAPGIPEHAVKVILPRTIEQVNSDLQPRFFDRLEVDFFPEVVDIHLAEIDIFDEAFLPCFAHRHGRDGILLSQSVRARLYVRRRLRQGRPPPGG